MFKEETTMCGFEELGKIKERKNLEILNLADERLLKVDPSREGFFKKIFENAFKEPLIKNFCQNVEEIQQAGLDPFWRPTLDPSLVENKIVFNHGLKPATGNSFNWWKTKTEGMNPVEKKYWKVGTGGQYYAYLVDLINKLVESGWSINKAMTEVVINSRTLGHYCNVKGALHAFECTGSREICGVCDHANTIKILACTDNEDVDFLLAGGCYLSNSFQNPLADLCYDTDMDFAFYYGVGWLVLT